MSSFHRPRIAIAIGTILSVAFTSLVISTTQLHASAANKCTDVEFIGVRGSSENSGLGPTVQAVYNTYVATTSKSVSLLALDYPAATVPVVNPGARIPAFIRSVNTGKDSLAAHLIAQQKKCPDQQIIIAGFSQGALVANEALRTVSHSVLSNVAGVALFGDPNFDPKFAGNVGTYAKNDKGILSTFTTAFKHTDYVPAPVANKTRSYCLAYDPTCNYSVVSAWRCFVVDKPCAHALYRQKGYTNQGAQFLDARTASSNTASAKRAR